MSSSLGQVSAALQWLESHTSMPAKACRALAELTPRLLARMPPSLAIGGPPGSGKSTLARMLAFLLSESGTPTILLSLDDYYLGRKDREDLAQNQHALLRQRGVPGTHDWPRLLLDFDRLSSARGEGLRLPVFDKSRDDPAPVHLWRQVDFNPRCVIVEGWCIGAPGQDPDRLLDPVNELERLEDPEAIWRTLVNHRLACYRSDLVSRVDQFWYLGVPAWDQVIDWRWRQEQELAQARLLSRVQTAAFLATFERIVRHMQETCATWADWRLQADALHRWHVLE
jgi:D-glycerate 3-kinase